MPPGRGSCSRLKRDLAYLRLLEELLGPEWRVRKPTAGLAYLILDVLLEPGQHCFHAPDIHATHDDSIH